MSSIKFPYDISMPIDENMIVYKNKELKKPEIETLSNHDSDNMHESRFHIDAHTGTHIDFPLHAISNGKVASDYPLESFMGSCYLFDLSASIVEITDDVIKNYIEEHRVLIHEGDILLFKTRNSPLRDFDFNFPFITSSGADYLASLPIKAIGIDQLGIERGQSDHPTHKVLLSKDILIYEGLELSALPSGRYFFYGLPLSFKAVEASPVRAFLTPCLF
jgi:arylformamidase